MEKKNTLIILLSVILMLIIAIAGFSYAMFSFRIGGQRESFIQAGEASININYTENTSINLTNQYPLSDAEGIAQVNHCDDSQFESSTACTEGGSSWINSTMNFTVDGTPGTGTTINYALVIETIIATNITESDIKIYLLENGTVAPSFTEGVGTTVNSLYTSAAPELADNYVINMDSFSNQGTHEYVLKAWISDQYELQIDQTGNTTLPAIYKFKVNLVATIS